MHAGTVGVSRAGQGLNVFVRTTRCTQGGAGAPVPGGGAGGYRLADYVPTGVVNMALDVDDINDFMLEQVRRRLRSIVLAQL